MKGFIGALRNALGERLSLFLWPLWILFAAEGLSRYSFTETITWALGHSVFFLQNAVLIAALLLLLVACVGRPKLAFLILCVLVLLPAFVSGMKLRMMGLPLLPWDFRLGREVLVVLDWSDVESLKAVLSLLALLVGSYLVAYGLDRPKAIALPQRAIFAGVGTVAVLVLLFAAHKRPEANHWDQATRVKASGFSLTMLDNLLAANDPSSRQSVPAVMVQEVLSLQGTTDEELEPERTATRPTAGKPNIILVLSESFWDPTQLPKVTYSQDPLPFFHALQQSHTSGWMLSPEFAGKTANVEFEVLTGLSMQFLPEGVLVTNHVDRPVDSLASILARQGYTSTVVSPWANWYFNAKRAYRNYGFSKFISQEFMKQDYSGYYIADREVARIIMAETDRTAQPDFIFATTAENHFNYNRGKFKERTIEVTGVTGWTRDLLETYGQGTYAADRMLETLVTHYSQHQEPTMIIFFGDHLPLLGNDYLAYRAGGYLTGPDDPDFLMKMHRVPVVVWTNYVPPRRESFTFGTNFLGPYILQQAGLSDTPLTAYLRELSERVPFVPHQKYWEEMRIPAAEMARYEAVQTDILFGDAKTYADYKERIIDPDYLLGYGPLRIASVDVDPGDDGETVRLTVRGQNFPPTAVVRLSGSKLETTWETYDTMVATLPSDQYRAGEASIQVLVYAPKSSWVVGQSDTLTVALPLRNGE